MSVSLHTDEIAASPTLRKSLLAMVPNLRAFAVSLCNDPEHADDLVQETILKAWSHLDSFQEGTNLRAWLAGSVSLTNFHPSLGFCSSPERTKPSLLRGYPSPS